MNIKGMLAGLVMAGSAAAMMGCNQPLASTSDQTDVATSTDDGAAPEVANWFSARTGWGRPVVARPVVGAYWHTGYARFAPPAARFEVAGRAPSYRHFWAPGYYRWSGARYNWVGGNWMLRRPGLRYVPGHYDRLGGVYHWVPARWVR